MTEKERAHVAALVTFFADHYGIKEGAKLLVYAATTAACLCEFEKIKSA